MKFTGFSVVFVIILAAFFPFSCTEENGLPSIMGADYKNEKSLMVYHTGEFTKNATFTVEGKDVSYYIKSMTTETFLGSSKSVCKISGSFTSGDHIKVTSPDMAGEGEFDVPDYME
jgi:hypothetical protein